MCVCYLLFQDKSWGRKVSKVRRNSVKAYSTTNQLLASSGLNDESIINAVMFPSDVMVFFLLFQGIEIGTELVAWGLTKGAEVGSHLMHKVVLCVSSHFFTNAAVYKAREQAQLHFASEKFFGVVRRHALLIKKQLHRRLS